MPIGDEFMGKFISYKENEYDITPANVEYDITSVDVIERGDVKVKVLPLLDKQGKRIETLKSKKALVPVQVTIGNKKIKAYIRVESLILIQHEDILHLIEGVAVNKKRKDTDIALGRIINLKTGTITKHPVQEYYRLHCKESEGFRPMVLTNPKFDTTISDKEGIVTLPYCSTDEYNINGVYINENCEYLKSKETGKIIPCQECASFVKGIGTLRVDKQTLRFITKEGANLGAYHITETDEMLMRHESVDKHDNLHRPRHISLPNVTEEIFSLIKLGYNYPKKLKNEMVVVDSSSNHVSLTKVESKPKQVDPASV